VPTTPYGIARLYPELDSLSRASTNSTQIERVISPFLNQELGFSARSNKTASLLRTPGPSAQTRLTPYLWTGQQQQLL
jgi:hypothetical protein